MGLQGGQRFRGLARRNRPSDAPAWHRERFGHSIDDDDGVQRLGKLEDGCRGLVIGDGAIDLVADDPPPVRLRDRDQPSQFVSRVDGTRSDCTAS